MAVQQQGTTLGGTAATTVRQSRDRLKAGRVARTLTRTIRGIYDDLVSNLEAEWPLGSNPGGTVGTTYPLLTLEDRDLAEDRKGTNGTLTLTYEQKEPDPDETEDPPEDLVEVEGSTSVASVVESLKVVGEAATLADFIDFNRGRFRTDPDVPEDIRGKSHFPKAGIRVSVTTYAATEYTVASTQAAIGIKSAPPGATDDDKWFITDGRSGRSGRWYTQTLVYSFDPDGYGQIVD